MDSRKAENKPPRAAGSVRERVLESGDLFAGKRQLRIMHNQEVYILRITASGKLILTK